MFDWYAINTQHVTGWLTQLGQRKCTRPYFERGAYTESDNAPALKQRSGHARLT